jgi:hypothetical protein
MPNFEKGLSHSWQIVLAFFLGGAVSSIAQDPSDTLFFWAASHNQLSTPTQQSLYWYWVPFLLYISLFFFGYAIAKIFHVKASFLLYFYAALVILSTFISLSLPENSSSIYVASVVLGTLVSLGIILGLKEQIIR